jgi:tetratricopeptide (TPR) repeat protein
MGSALAKLKRYPEAIVCYQEALRLDSSSTTAWFDIGVIHAARGDDEAAIECYDRALLAYPANTDARFNRANALRRRKKFDTAAQEMRRVRTVLPGQSAAWLAEAVCFIRMDLTEEALRVCVEGLSATGRNRRLVSMHARLLATSENPTASEIEQSLAEIEELLANQTTLEEVESKAMLLAASGRHADALRWQDAAIGAARNASRDDIVKRLLGNRELYSRGFPASDPWPEEESSSSPPSGEVESSGEASQDTSP